MRRVRHRPWQANVVVVARHAPTRGGVILADGTPGVSDELSAVVTKTHRKSTARQTKSVVTFKCPTAAEGAVIAVITEITGPRSQVGHREVSREPRWRMAIPPRNGTDRCLQSRSDFASPSRHSDREHPGRERERSVKGSRTSAPDRRTPTVTMVSRQRRFSAPPLVFWTGTLPLGRRHLVGARSPLRG